MQFSDLTVKLNMNDSLYSCKEMEQTIFPNNKMGPYSNSIIHYSSGFYVFKKDEEGNKKPSFWSRCWPAALPYNILFKF